MKQTWVFLIIAATLVAVMNVVEGQGKEKGYNIQENEQQGVFYYHFSSEQYKSNAQGHGQHSKTVVFDENHWYSEYAYLNDASYNYIYYNGGDHYGRCEHVGDHHNCFVLSGGKKQAEVVPVIPDDATYVNCPVIRDPILGGSKRKLTKCYYTHLKLPDTENNMHELDYWVEFGTNYPVRTMDKVTDKYGSVKYTMTDYCTFETIAQNDKAKLSPIAGVKVYDFRNGKEGLFTESEAQTVCNGYKRSKEMSIIKPFSLLQNHTKRHPDFVYGFVGPSMGPAPVYTMTARDTIPESFDARVKWPKCNVIKEIKNQGGCGSCWSMASSSVLADRMCIYTDGSVDVSLSPQFMVNCYPNQNGCDGGFGESVWKDLMEIGTVPESCLPFEQSGKTCTGRCGDGMPMPKAAKTKNLYSPWGNTDKARVEAIQREIMEHGPVSASFHVFDDWEEQKKWPKPVYHRSESAVLKGGHSVRIIGWGTENGEDYWLIANSHGTDFRENGFFKMRRGINECNIEETVVAGEPLIE